MMGLRVIVVGGHDNDPEEWINHLREGGFNLTLVTDGASALRQLEGIDPDLLIISLQLEGPLDGIETCRAVRAFTAAPVVVFAEAAGAHDEVVALAVGADHFVTGDTATEVVMARLRSLVRRARGDVLLGSGIGGVAGGTTAQHHRSNPDAGHRRPRGEARPSGRPGTGGAPRPVPMGGAGADAPGERIVDGDLEVDPIMREVRVAGTEVPLTRTEFDLLETLAREPRRVFSREQLMASAWEEPFDGSHVLNSHLSRLRRKVMEAGGCRVAHAVRGVGFRLRG
jgi:DNA-binding response OmpR family regulator